MEPTAYGSMLVPVLLNKLPPDARFIISRRNGGSEPDIDQLLRQVEEELAARERSFFFTSNLPDREVEIKFHCSSYKHEANLCTIMLLLPSKALAKGLYSCNKYCCSKGNTTKQWSLLQLFNERTSEQSLPFIGKMQQLPCVSMGFNISYTVELLH